MELKKISKCRICGSDKLTSILSLNDQYLAGYSPKENDLDPITQKYPLELVRCNPMLDPTACGLVQLRHSVSPDLMYRRYFYKSGINKTMSDNLSEIVNQAKSYVTLTKNDIVLDIGCNDGTLLKNYQNDHVRSVGIDPAKNMAKFSRQSGATIIINYFSKEVFFKHFENEQAKIITSIAMFYDLENPNTFVEDVSKILHPEGVWILELSYLGSMLQQNAFDTIVHEHLEYYHFSVIEYILSKFELQVTDVFLNNVNGGSFRIFIKHKSQKITNDAFQRINNLRKSEEDIGLQTSKPYDEFFHRCNEERQKLVNFIKDEIARGKTIYGYGASTKGNTLLQFCKIDNKLLQGIADRNPDKWGRETIGTNLKIVSEEYARNTNPDYFLILPWHFINEFKEREQNFFQKGGKFVVPLPTFQIIDT